MKYSHVILIVLSMFFVSCGRKTVDAVSYIKRGYGVSFCYTIQMSVIKLSLITNMNEGKDGMYSCGALDGHTTQIGRWELRNDTLTLFPKYEIKIYGDKVNYISIDEKGINDRSIDDLITTYKVRDDKLYDITDYTEFYKWQKERLGYKLDYKYNPDELEPVYKMIQYKDVKKRKGIISLKRLSGS